MNFDEYSSKTCKVCENSCRSMGFLSFFLSFYPLSLSVFFLNWSWSLTKNLMVFFTTQQLRQLQQQREDAAVAVLDNFVAEER